MTLQQESAPTEESSSVTIYDELKIVLDKTGALSDLNKLGSDGLSPLHVSVRDMRLDCAGLLLARGADPNIRSRANETPLDQLVDDESPSTLEYQYMYEVFEFNTLVRSFPDETVTLFVYGVENNLHESREELKMTITISIANIQEFKLIPTRFHGERLGRKLTWIHVDSTNVRSITLFCYNYEPWTIYKV
jgi:Ankyrin repeats (many copies)